MKKRAEGFRIIEYLLFGVITLGTLILCVCIGSVGISPAETVKVVWNAICGNEIAGGAASSIIVSVRLPRVICVALSGAALSLCGAAMQGLLRNPLADGSTLGVSAGASLGR